MGIAFALVLRDLRIRTEQPGHFRALCRIAAFVFRRDDREPSLTVTDSKCGKVLVRCHAGCDQRDVIAALKGRGLEIAWAADFPDGPFRQSKLRVTPVIMTTTRRPAGLPARII